MGMFSESVDVVCTPAGQPLQLDWAGRHYTVCAEPVRWYERRQWWAEEQPGPARAAGPGWWTTRSGGSRCACGLPGPRPRTTLTLDLTRHVGSGRWRLLRIHDALPPLRKPETA